MAPTLALFIGNKFAFSVQRLLENLAWMLGDDFALHLVTAYRDPVPVETDGFEQVYRGSRRRWLHPYRSEHASLGSYLDTHDPDAVVQLTEPPRIGAITGIVARKYGVPFVYRYSGDRFIMYRYKTGIGSASKQFFVDNVVGRLPLVLADYHVVLGPTGRRRLTDRGVPAAGIHELPATVDTARFDTDLNGETPVVDSIPDDRSVALFVGRLSRPKGIDTMEYAIPKVIDERDDVHFLFVGSGSPPDLPSEYRDHVTAVGTVDPESMPHYYHLSNVLIHPSYAEGGVPRTIMEAMAADTPVLARDISEVSTVTENTFEDDAEFVTSLIDFESLLVEDVTPFARTRLKERYVRSFAEICANGDGR